MKKIILLVLISSLIFLSNCEKESQFDKDIALIEQYISDNGLNAQSTESGLHYVIEELGTGSFPQPNSNVRVHYEGFLLDGTKFDSSIDRGQLSTFNLQNVIQGWSEGMLLLKEGGKGKFIIPSRLGYGDSGTGAIPANSVLIFNVELFNVF